MQDKHMRKIEKEIRMVDLKAQYLSAKIEIDAAIAEVIESTQFINGPIVKAFSKELADFLGAKHVIPCGNGTDALMIALMALELKEGDEIITTPFTFVATAETIAILGLRPVFVDVEEDSFNMDINDLKKKITHRTKVILPVHLFGQCSNMIEISKLAKEHSLYVIEDNAQSIGATLNNENNQMQFTGTFGDIGTLSFFPSKNLGCYGDGGALICNDDRLAERIAMICKHGSKVKYYHEIVGVNSRLDAIQAAVLRVKLTKLVQYNTHRAKAADIYDAALGIIDEIVIPKRKYGKHVFHQYTLKCQRRDELKEFLKKNDIPSMIYYPVPLHIQGAFSYLGYSEKDFPVSESLSTQVLSLPMHSEITKDEQLYICSKIKEFYLSR